MKRVMIIGSPGAGKSTFARKLRDYSGLPLYYLDQIWHLPDRTTISPAAFDARLMEILAEDQWIIDGNYSRTMELRLKACDTVFLLDYPLAVCLDGVRKRVGQKREDMPWIEEAVDEDFRTFILDFPHTQLPRIYRLLERYQNEKQIILFRSREEAEDWLNRFRSNLQTAEQHEDNQCTG